jgi:hypothetical protein
MLLPTMIDGGERLEDEQIERQLRASFAPHRCAVRFQNDAFGDGRKVALLIHVRIGVKLGEQEFYVEGVPIDLLRDRSALLEYIDDIRRQLQQRRVAFSSIRIG